MRFAAVVCCLAFLFACADADTAPTTSRARAIEREVWSPYCPGRLLVDCTTEQARELRTEIDERVARGDSTDEVFQWIRANHGDEALARPDARGAGLLIWLVPAAIFLIGAVIVAVSVRRWTRRPDRASTPRT